MASFGLIVDGVLTSTFEKDGPPRYDDEGNRIREYQEYTMLSMLSAGVYGEVWRAQNTTTEEFVAIKFYKDLEQGKKDWETEAAALALIAQSENEEICDLVACPIEAGEEIIFDQTRYYIVLKLARFFNDLFDMATKSMVRFKNPPSRSRGSMRRKQVQVADHVRRVKLLTGYQLITSVQALHAAGVVHADLHAGNVVITDDLADAMDVEEWRKRFGNDAIQCFRPLETKMDRYLRLRPVYGFRGDDEQDWILTRLRFDTRLLDLNLAILETDEKFPGSRRDPTLQGACSLLRTARRLTRGTSVSSCS